MVAPKGSIPWNKGKKLSQEHINNISNSIKKRYKEGKIVPYWKGKKRPHLSERYKSEGNPIWKGDKVKYHALHEWIRTHKPKPSFCESCKIKEPSELANISQKYKRDVNDFEWLCKSCHSKQHRGKEWHNNIIQYKKGGIKWTPCVTV